jgi:hypothetical protein
MATITLISIASGAFVLVYLFTLCAPDIELYLGVCKPAAEANPLYTGIPLIDTFFCFNVKFFSASMETTGGLYALNILAMFAMSVFAIYAVESSRLGVSIFHPLGWYVVFAAFSMFIGISIGAAMFWTPLALWFYKSPRDIRITESRVVMIGIALVAVASAGFATTFFNAQGPAFARELEISILVWVFGCVLAFVVWIFVPVTGPSCCPRGHIAVIVMHGLFAGLNIVFYAYTLLIAYTNKENMFMVIYNSCIDASMSHAGTFIAIDLVLMTAAMLFFVLGSSGLCKALCLLLLVSWSHQVLRLHCISLRVKHVS